MKLTEGRCPNCGSILMLDHTQEKGHCLYCEAVFDNTQAIKLGQDDTDYTYPNLPQEKYEGPNLDPVVSRVTMPFSSVPSASQAKVAQKPTVKIEGKKIPSLTLSKKTKMGLCAGFFGVAILFMAVALPMTMVRNRHNQAVIKNFSESVKSIDISEGVNFSLKGLRSNRALLVVDRSLTEEEIWQIFEDYASARAKALNIDSHNEKSVYDTLNMSILTPEKTWRIQPRSSEDKSSWLSAQD